MTLATPARAAALRTFSVPSMFTERNRRGPSPAVAGRRYGGSHPHRGMPRESRRSRGCRPGRNQRRRPAGVVDQVKPPAPIAGTHLLDEQRAEVTGTAGHEASSGSAYSCSEKVPFYRPLEARPSCPLPATAGRYSSSLLPSRSNSDRLVHFREYVNFLLVASC